MSGNSTEMSGIDANFTDIQPVWRKIEFSLFLFCQLVSIPCYFFVLYHLLAHSAARKALQNHAIVVLLVFNFFTLTVDQSMAMSLSQLGYIASFTPGYCLVWQYVDYGIWYGGLFMMLWTSIERHILIFHSALVRTTRGRLLIHYIPLAFFALYAPILYFYLVFICPCDQEFFPMNDMCGDLCYYNVVPDWYIWYESLVNYTIPVLLIGVLSVGIIVRAIAQRRGLQQATRWRQYRKMIIQLLFVSTVYLIFDLPYIIIMIVRWAGIPDFGTNISTPYISHLTYAPAIVLPHVILVTLPEVKQKLRRLLICKKRRQTIAPQPQAR